MTVTIGRDSKTGQLRLVAGPQSMTVGAKQSVPMSVGREHVSLNIDDDGVVTLRNLNIENDTFVNGVGFEVKRIKGDEKIELGNERYSLEWDVIKPFMPKFADIRPLKKVWDNYQDTLLQHQIKERRSGVLRSVTGLITMGAMVLGVFSGRDNMIFAALYAVAAIISLLFFVKAFIDSSKLPQQQQAIRDSLPKKYVCPCCGHFMGAQSYEVIAQNKACPYCKAIYIK